MIPDDIRNQVAYQADGNCQCNKHHPPGWICMPINGERDAHFIKIRMGSPSTQNVIQVCTRCFEVCFAQDRRQEAQLQRQWKQRLLSKNLNRRKGNGY